MGFDDTNETQPVLENYRLLCDFSVIFTFMYSTVKVMPRPFPVKGNVTIF